MQKNPQPREYDLAYIGGMIFMAAVALMFILIAVFG